jgi:hypothetical protein
MRSNPAPTKSPISFEPETQEREVLEMIDERQEAILHRAAVWEPFEVIHEGRGLKWIDTPEPVEPILDPVQIESDFEQLVLKRLSQHLLEPVSPDEIERGTVEEVLRSLDVHERQTQEVICERILDIYSGLEVNELAPEEVVNMKQVAEEMARLGKDESVVEAETLIQNYFDHVEDHPLVSKREESTLAESLTVDEARELLKERKEDLRETAREVFGEVNEEIIEEMQEAYLELIWDDIE